MGPFVSISDFLLSTCYKKKKDSFAWGYLWMVNAYKLKLHYFKLKIYNHFLIIRDQIY